MENIIKITAIALDPIYIGTGGYTIGRVDNTIVRDPITNLPKIPGSSLAGTWRYYGALKLLDEKSKNNIEDYKEILKKIKSEIDDNYKKDSKTLETKLNEYLKKSTNLKEKKEKIEKKWIKDYIGNLFGNIKCAGQDEASTDKWGNTKEGAGHCGHCIVCHSFGFSKKDLSYQGRLFFSDLQIFAFPVSTYKGIYWIINPEFVKQEELNINDSTQNNDNKIIVKTKDGGEINLGYLNFKTNKVDGNNGSNLENVLTENGKNYLNQIDENINSKLKENFVIVGDDLFSQIVNANLETRTSVSIDPITGAAKEKALFTSEATPRLTIFVGEIRFKKPVSEDKIAPNLTFKLVENMLKDTKDLFEVFGIGGMTTRGFGRLKVDLKEDGNENNGSKKEGTTENNK